MTTKTEPFHLYEDEMLRVGPVERKADYRIRVWGKSGHLPVVIVESVDPIRSPCRSHSIKIAKFVWGAILGFPEAGARYYEVDNTKMPQVCSCRFGFIGGRCRQRQIVGTIERIVVQKTFIKSMHQIDIF